MNIKEQWEKVYKPKVLDHKVVPIDLVAEILGCSVTKVKDRLRQGSWTFAQAAKGQIDYCYQEIYPLRFIAWYEGQMQ